MKETINLTWDDILTRLRNLHIPVNSKIYGVPNGGMILAGYLRNIGFHQLVTSPIEADIILDDVEDSGSTRRHFKAHYPHASFHALYRNVEFDGKWLSFPWERDHPGGGKTVQDNILRIIQFIGEDPTRDGLLDTPRRVVKSYAELFSGYGKNPREMMTTFKNDGEYSSMVLLRDIEIYSCCEHHMLPFYGKAHVAYIPDNGKIVGISKLARLVDIYARRLQVQERIGEQVTDALMEILKPKGAACVIEAVHMCMLMRGVGKQNSVMVTSSVKGEFMTDPAVREEFMDLIQKGK